MDKELTGRSSAKKWSTRRFVYVSSSAREGSRSSCDGGKPHVEDGKRAESHRRRRGALEEKLARVSVASISDVDGNSQMLPRRFLAMAPTRLAGMPATGTRRR
jgi:hypothetical protein